MTGEHYSDTIWTRLEPISRDAEKREGLRAETADPLWLLTRQWQFGEFDGEDAGSPVDVHVDATFDHLSRVQHRGGDDETDPIPYDGGPLEATVERETVLRGAERPDSRLAANAGRQFLRLCADAADLPDDLDAGDFPAGYLLSEAAGDDGEPASHRGQRFAEFVEGRCLDGHLLYRALSAALDDDWSDSALPWGDDGPDGLPVPDGVSADGSGPFAAVAADYREWYGTIYDEPTEESGAAWDPERLEYDVRVATGAPGTDDGDTETVLAAPDYPGGRLDWSAFSPANSVGSVGPDSDGGADGDGGDDGDDPTLFDGDAPDAPDDLRTSHTEHVLPTKPAFKGMPAPRFWTFEDGDVRLEGMASDDVSSQALLHYALVFGNDWYQFPLDTPLGSLARVESLTVTDCFGVEQPVGPITDEQWNAFSVRDLPRHDEPGLFVPPVLEDVTESDPVERVSMARDEIANLAFAIEERVEDPTGQPVERDEYVRPSLVLESLDAVGDVEAECAVFRNPGRRPLDVGGWIVTDHAVAFTVPDGTEVPPDGTLHLYTGAPDPDEHPDDSVHWERDASVWDDEGGVTVVSVYEPCDCDDDHEITPQTVTAEDPPSSHLEVRRRVPLDPPQDRPTASYALATDLFDHWFALRPTAVSQDGGDPDPWELQYRHYLELALVLDAEALDATSQSELPRPAGRILRPSPEDPDAGLRIYDEEILAEGTEVTRSYQLATWTDGTAHLWSGREVRPSLDEVGSHALAFDVLDNWSPNDGE